VVEDDVEGAGADGADALAVWLNANCSAIVDKISMVEKKTRWRIPGTPAAVAAS
jgi:hypothetical protein